MTSTEQTFYSDKQVTVTNSRFVLPGQTIAMSGITAVTTYKHNMSKIEIALLVLGLLIIFLVHSWGIKILIGLPMLAYGIWAYLNPVYSLFLTSSSGNRRAVYDRKKSRIFTIAEAINQVIIHRS